MTERTQVPEEFRSQTGNAPAASQKQLDFILSLAEERDVTEAARAELVRRATEGDISKRRASEFITRLLDKPKRATEQPAKGGSSPDWPDVPEGRYALRQPEADQGGREVVKFYRVDRPTEGRWAGYTFLAAGAGGPHDDPNWHPIKNASSKRAILELIEADPRAAAILYGQELGECGVCGRTLTDETSRAYGIGPICRGRTGW